MSLTTLCAAHGEYSNTLKKCPVCPRPGGPNVTAVLPGEQGFGERAKDPITNFPDIDSFLRETFEVMRRKGHDYRQGNDSDILHNFRTVSKMVGTPMEKVWYTYFYKHLSALITYVKEGGQSESEPIEGRITDLIVYLVLFWRMVQESKNIAPSRPPSASMDMMGQTSSHL